jgi:uncharacterized protein (DUF2336 family)
MNDQLTNLASAIAAADELLGRAERQGMEVSQAMQQEEQARDALLKARVTVHTFSESELKKDTNTGFAIARQTHAAGETAMKEWRFRRVGLGWSVAAIALALVGLGLYIRKMEQE